jgi:hypothetical protein
MALMPAFRPRESSARMTRDFAIHAAGLLDNPQAASDDEVSLQNIYRLLEMYRFDSFVAYSPKGILEGQDLRRQTDVNASAGTLLKRALDQAKERVFPALDRQHAVELLERTISAIAGSAPPNPAELQHTKRFFEELATALKPA